MRLSVRPAHYFLAVLALAGAASWWWAKEPTPEHHRLSIQNLEFEQISASVDVGDTITWTNLDIVPHTVTDANGEWDSGEMASGVTFSLVIEDLDTLSFLCRYHPTMTGMIEVSK